MPPATSIAAPARVSTVHRSILHAALSVGAAGIVVKLIATGKEIAVASVYGRSDAMDAFLAAALIPSLLVNLISESMNQALVPTLIRVREQEGRERAQQLLSNSMLWMCLLLGAASALMALLAHGFFPLIASNFPPAKLALSIRLFYGLLPIVLLTGIATNCTAILNTLDRFALPALAPAVISISVILGALLFGSRLGIWAMVYATLAGAVSTAIVPYFSRMIAHREWAGCRHTIRTWVQITAVVSVPIALLLIAGAQPLVRVAYQHGHFGPRDTVIVAAVLAMYAVQIPFYVTSRVYYRFIVAMRRTDLVLYCGTINLGLDIVLNLALMHWFVLMHWPGVAGIALATSLWTVSTFFFLRYWSRKLLGRASAAEAAA